MDAANGVWEAGYTRQEDCIMISAGKGMLRIHPQTGMYDGWVTFEQETCVTIIPIDPPSYWLRAACETVMEVSSGPYKGLYFDITSKFPTLPYVKR